MSATHNKEKRSMWSFPWNYRESFTIALSLLLISLLLQSTTRACIEPVSAPFNLILGILFIFIIIVLQLGFRTTSFVKWLRSVPASVSAISLMLLLTVVLGVFPQKERPETMFGTDAILSSWPFLIAQIYFLLTLGMCTINRMFPWKTRNIGFILNHLGLFIALGSGILGRGDVQRYTMELRRGQPEWRAVDKQGSMKDFPFAFDLQSFDMDTYPAKLGLANINNDKIEQKGTNALRTLVKGDNYTFNNLNIQVIDYLENSKFTGEKYDHVNEIGAVPSAYLRVRSENPKIDTTGWISCGSFNTSYSILPIDQKYALVMLRPEARKFSTSVNVYYKDKSSEKATIEVNKPYTADSWNVYQLSYDEKYGKYSPLSIIELVRDPWLPVVYLGVFMMILGSVYIILKGAGGSQEFKQEKDNEL